jgi:beta-lactam-binding protein with PASTA domain
MITNTLSAFALKTPQLQSRTWLMRIYVGSMFLGLIATFAFPTIADDPTKRIAITASSVDVMLGTKKLGTVSADQEFNVLGQSGSWYQIEFEVNGKLEKGWIKEKDVRVLEANDTETDIAPPVLAPPPESQKWLLVTNDKTELKRGQETVGTVRRNQVFPITKREGSWLQVRIFEDGALTTGFVRESQCRVLEAREVGPALHGGMPTSIAEATIDVDWKTKDVVLKAAVPFKDREQLTLMSATGTEEADLGEMEVDDTTITIRANDSDWQAFVRQGTRSLWIKEGESENPKWHRIDLPGVAIGTTVTATKFPNFPEGLVIYVPVSGLLPGFVVEHAYKFGNESPTQVDSLSTTIGSLPRVADISAGKNGFANSLRIVVPYAATKDEVITHLVLVRRPDGSLSQGIQFQRKGDTISGAAQEITAAISALIDATVAAPSLELVPAQEAVAQTRSLGLTPIVIDELTYEKIDLTKLSNAMILRQGVPPGEPLLTGSELVLGMSSNDGASVKESFELVDDSKLGLQPGLNEEPLPPDTATPENNAELKPEDTANTGNVEIINGGGLITGNDLDETTLNDNADLIDTGEELTFIDPQNTGLVSGTDGLQGLVDPNTGPDTGLIMDDGSIDLNDGDPDDGGLIGGDTGTVPGLSDPGGGVVVPIDPDPGISLDPLSDPEKTLLTGILKIIIAAILNQPDPNLLPGPIGAAITLAISNEEANLIKAKEEAAELAVVERIFDIVLKQFSLSLTDAQRTAAIDAWKASRQYTTQPSLDKNKNGVMADDVVLFFVIWFHQQSLFNPASHIVISPNGSGGTVAVLPEKPISVDWLKDLIAILKPGQPIKPIIPPPPPGPITPPVDPLASIPTGKAIVEGGDGPDLVKVPNVEELLVEKAKQQLEALGLVISNLKELFSTDKVVESTLGAGEWVKPGTATQIRILRKVPDLKHFTVKDGKGVLSKNKLTYQAEGKHSLTDIIVEQTPRAGEFIDPVDPVRIDVAMIAPDVVGTKLSDASTKLSDRDLKWESDTKAFQVDRVVKQTPKAGSLVQHGETLNLVLHLPMPNVVGMTLDRAKSVAAEWDVDLNYRNQLARDEDIVRGQNPSAQSYVPHRSDLNVGPIMMRIPDVRGLSVERAEQELAAEDLETSRIGNLIRSDRVTMQTPSAGEEKERGATVQLDSRVRLPNFVGSELLRARESLQGQEGELRVVVNGPVGSNDVVYSQRPQGDTLVPPRTEVILVPGVNVPRLIGATPAEADRALQRAGLAGQIVSSGTADTEREDLAGRTFISGQDPPPGLHRRDQVGRVELAATQYKLALVTVPDVREMRISAAIQSLRASGLNVIIMLDRQRLTPAEYTAKMLIDLIGGANDDGQNQEPVVSAQDPAPFSSVKKGTTVTISGPIYK